MKLFPAVCVYVCVWPGHNVKYVYILFVGSGKKKQQQSLQTLVYTSIQLIVDSLTWNHEL